MEKQKEEQLLVSLMASIMWQIMAICKSHLAITIQPLTSILWYMVIVNIEKVRWNMTAIIIRKITVI